MAIPTTNKEFSSQLENPWPLLRNRPKMKEDKNKSHSLEQMRPKQMFIIRTKIRKNSPTGRDCKCLTVSIFTKLYYHRMPFLPQKNQSKDVSSEKKWQQLPEVASQSSGTRFQLEVLPDAGFVSSTFLSILALSQAKTMPATYRMLFSGCIWGESDNEY